MAFNGSWLIKVGSFEFPLRLIKYGSYVIAPAQRQDVDSYVDGDGYLHRNPVVHTRSKITFETIPMSVKDMEGLMQAITDNYSNGLEKKVVLTYYEPEYSNYITGEFYMAATQEYTMLNKQYYDSVKFVFVEY